MSSRNSQIGQECFLLTKFCIISSVFDRLIKWPLASYCGKQETWNAQNKLSLSRWIQNWRLPNCLLHVAAVAVENLVKARTVSVLTKCREQAGAGWWLLRGLSAPAICAARGSLRSVRPRWRALFIIYRDGVNNNLFPGLPPLLPLLRDLLLLKYTRSNLVNLFEELCS